jgi:2Fe-2S ferredoxin
MLNSTADERLPSSRLSCQIKLGEELDGLILRLPAEQL